MILGEGVVRSLFGFRGRPGDHVGRSWRAEFLVRTRVSASYAGRSPRCARSTSSASSGCRPSTTVLYTGRRPEVPRAQGSSLRYSAHDACLRVRRPRDRRRQRRLCRRRTARCRERRARRARRGRPRLRPARTRVAGPPTSSTEARLSAHTTGATRAGPLPRRREIGFPRARVIGGCSSHNGCVVAVGCPADYDGWADRTRDDRWRAEAIRPALARALARLAVRSYAADEIGPFHRACLEAAAALGLPRADDLDELDGGVGFGTEPVNIAGGIRMNAAFAYLDPVRERSNLTILDRGCLRSPRLCGDRRARRSFAATARPCASRPGPSCWRRARTGPRRSCSARAIGGHERSSSGPGSPRSSICLVWDGTSTTTRSSSSSSPARASCAGSWRKPRRPASRPRSRPWASSARAARPVRTTSSLPGGGARSQPAGRARADRRRGAGAAVAREARDPRSRPEAHPTIEHGYLSDTAGHDRAVLAEGIERARELATTMPLSALLGHELTPSRGHSIEEFHAHYYHPVGTCAMGAADDPLAVCDGAGRVHGSRESSSQTARSCPSFPGPTPMSRPCSWASGSPTPCSAAVTT